MVFMMTSCSTAGGYQVSEDMYCPTKAMKALAYWVSFSLRR